MKQIIDDYSPILEDVPFEEIKKKLNKGKDPQTSGHQQGTSNESSLSSSRKKKEKQNVH